MISFQGASVYIFGGIFSIFFIFVAGYFRNSACASLQRSKALYNRYNRYGAFFLLLSCASLWVIAAVRKDVGVDFFSYQRGYMNINSFSDIANYYEPGYGLLNYIVKVVFDDFQWVIITTSLLTGYFLWKVMYRDSSSLVLCLVGVIATNLYFMSFSVIRQFLAIAILMLSIISIEQKKFFRFLIYFLLAISLHYTAIVFFFVYYFNNQRNDKILSWKNILFVCGGVFLFLHLDTILTQVISIGGSVRENLLSYTTQGGDKSILELIAIVPPTVYVVVFRKRLITLNPRNKVYIWMEIFYVITKFVGFFATSFSRVNYYFVLSIPILLSYFPQMLKKNTRFVAYTVTIFYYTWMLSNIIEYQWADFLPYYSIWSR